MYEKEERGRKKEEANKSSYHNFQQMKQKFKEKNAQEGEDTWKVGI
jgi:hypothetical protein